MKVRGNIERSLTSPVKGILRFKINVVMIHKKETKFRIFIFVAFYCDSLYCWSIM